MCICIDAYCSNYHFSFNHWHLRSLVLLLDLFILGSHLGVVFCGAIDCGGKPKGMSHKWLTQAETIRNLQCLMSYRPCLAKSWFLAYCVSHISLLTHQTYVPRCCRDWPLETVRLIHQEGPDLNIFEQWITRNWAADLGYYSVTPMLRLIWIELIHSMISDDAIWQIFPGVLLNKLPTRYTSTIQNNWRHARLGCSSTVTSVNQIWLAGNSPFSWITFQLKTSMRIHL